MKQQLSGKQAALKVDMIKRFILTERVSDVFPSLL